jgi:hypothetical protein
MNLEEREQGLLRLVAQYRDSECRALLDAARTEACTLLARTYQGERARLHQRVVSERAEARARIHAARAERDTRERAGGERANAALIAAAWPLLRESLRARWHDPEARRAWVESVIEQGLRVLPLGTWTLHHAPDGPILDWQTLIQDLAVRLGAEPRVFADQTLVAGLQIECGAAILDGSLEGLLRDRSRIEARLLALWSGSDDGPGENRT